MDWQQKLKCCAFAVASVALGISVVYIQQQRAAAKQRRSRVPSQQDISVMAATSEIENSPNPVSQLITTMEQINISQHASESPQPPEEEILDRDSANQSPSDFLSGNLHSDSHSESSNDSGKGGSDCANTNGDAHASSRFDVITPPMSPHHSSVAAIPLPERLFVYEFEIPQQLCGLLIGKYGAYVNQIKIKTGASLLIKDHNKRSKICAVEGTKNEIDSALALIRQKFPLKRYPQVTLTQLNVAPETTIAPVLPDSIQLVLPPEVSCEVMVSAVVAPNHIFLQQITHPTYPSLARLDQCMTMCYNEFVTPGLPQPIRPSMICAAPSTDGWYRAKVIAVHPSQTAVTNEVGENGEIIYETGLTEKTSEEIGHSDILEADEDCEVDICFVDYGGYSRVPASSLRQIRADFMTLPFQAIECLLANVAPTNVDEGWSNESYEVLESVTRDQLLQAQAVAYSMEGLPLVYLYQTDSSEEALINRQLVNQGVAQWVEPQMASN